MTIPFSNRVRVYTLTAGQTGPFDFPFPLLSVDDLRVTRRRTGVDEPLLASTHYTVALVSSPPSATVTLTAPSLNDDVLVLEGLRPPALAEEYAGNTAYTAAQINGHLERLTVELQEVRRDVDRAAKKNYADTSAYPPDLPVNTGWLYKDASGRIVADEEGGGGSTTSGNIAVPANVTALLPKIGDLVLSLDSTPAPGRIRLQETPQSVLKASWPELHTWIAARAYPWGSTATHFTLPAAADYIRFAGTGRDAGSWQDEQYKAATIPATGLTATTNITPNPHSHTVPFQQGGTNFTGGALPAPAIAGTVASSTVTLAATTTIAGNVSLAGGSELRVKNTAVWADVIASTALAVEQVAVFGYPYAWDTGTAAADPGAGKVRGNNAALASITELYINNADRWGQSLAGLFGALIAGNTVQLSKVGAQGNRVLARLSGVPVAGAGFYTIPIATMVLATGALAASDSVALEVGLGAAGGGGSGPTNLAYTASPTNGTVTSDTGADATLPLSDGSNAGLMAPAQHAKLAGIEAGATADMTGGEIVAAINSNLGGTTWQSGGGGGGGGGDLFAANNLSDLASKVTARQNLKIFHFAPEDAPYNAVGDGVTDDTAAMTAFWAAVNAAGNCTVWLNGNYLDTLPRTITASNVFVIGGGKAKHTASGSGSLFGMLNIGSGLSSISPGNLAANAALGDTTLVFATNTTGMAVGKLIRIDFGTFPNDKSMTARIETLNAGTKTITISHPLPWAITTSDTLTVTCGTPIENVRITGLEMAAGSHSGSLRAGIRLNGAYRCTVEHTRTSGMIHGGILVTDSVNCSIDDHIGIGDGAAAAGTINTWGAGDAGFPVYSSTGLKISRVTLRSGGFYFPVLLKYVHHSKLGNLSIEGGGKVTHFVRALKPWDCTHLSIDQVNITDVYGAGQFIEQGTSRCSFSNYNIRVLRPGKTVSATVTMTIATPGVVTWTAHGQAANAPIIFETTGALPTGATAGVTYYVKNQTTNTFEFSATPGGASINTSGSQSGVHTGYRGDPAQGYATNGGGNNDNSHSGIKCHGTDTLAGGSDFAVAAGDLRNRFDLSCSCDTFVINEPTTTWGATAVGAYDAIHTRGTDIASSSTVNLDNATGPYVEITGTTTILAFTLADGKERLVRFTAQLTITYNASTLIVPGSASITTAVGDVALIRGYSGGVVRVLWYQRATGQPAVTTTVANGGTGRISLTANAVLTGNGGSAINQIGPGAANSVLTGTGAAPAFSTTPTLESLNLNTSANGLSLGNIKVLYFSSSIYTAINDPSGTVKFFFGNASDPNAYFGSNEYRFRLADNTTLLAKLNATAFELSVPLKLKSYTVATLPAAGTVGAGGQAFVTDAAASPVWNANAAGGGSVGLSVTSDGTNWKNS